MSSFRRISSSISRGIVVKVAICEKLELSIVGLVPEAVKLVGGRGGYSSRLTVCFTSGWRWLGVWWLCGEGLDVWVIFPEDVSSSEVHGDGELRVPLWMFVVMSMTGGLAVGA